MTSKQLRAALKKLGMKHDQYASLIGLSPRTLRHYLNPAMTGVTNIPAAILTTLLMQQKITVNDIRKTRQSHSPSSKAEQLDFYRRIGSGPVTIVDRRLR